ncbi:MAG: S24 family peptidase [Verrucomicrobia bacterium]|nr:S24 family peptidase [Verrucomicrobiota bacterium]
MALARGVQSLAGLAEALVRARPEPQLRLFALDDARIEREAFKTLLPLYSLKAAAGYLGEGEAVEAEAWIEADGVGRLDDQRFVCRAVGRSMEPGIRDGDYVVFRARPAGTRLGKIVLVQYRGPADPDTSGSYAVKCYASGKQRDDEGGWKHTRVILDAGDAESVQAIGPATVRGLTGADWDGSSCQRFNIDPVAFFGAFRGPTVGAGEGGLSAETAFRARPHSLFVSGRTQLSNVTSLIGRSSLFLPKKEAGPDGKSGPFREQNPLLDAAPQTYAMGCTRITAFLHRNRGDRVPVITCPTSHQNWGQALYPGNLLPAVGADVRRRPGS